MRLSPEGETHSPDITHGLTQRRIALEAGVGVDIGVDLQIDVIHNDYSTTGVCKIKKPAISCGACFIAI
jgi:hypothetical protein